MEVTSNHLEIGPPRIVDQEEVGEELSRRSANFGTPVGKSVYQTAFSCTCYSPVFPLIYF